jgi:hypothetical protein
MVGQPNIDVVKYLDGRRIDKTLFSLLPTDQEQAD